MTNFKEPLKIGDPATGLGSAYDTFGYVPANKVIALGGGGGQTRQIVSFPAKTTPYMLGFVQTSAFGGVDTAASAMVVSFGNSSDATRYGVFNVSAGAGAGSRFAFNVSAAADFDLAGTMIVTLSALSTTTYTGGGRAIVGYVTGE